MSSIEEVARSPSETSSTNADPAPYAVTEKQLAAWGLGRGIKATDPKRILQVITPPIISSDGPTRVEELFDVGPMVEELRMETGYSHFSVDVWSQSNMTKMFCSSLKSELSQSLNFDFGFKYDRISFSKTTVCAVGHQIRKRTYAFRFNGDAISAADPTVSSTLVETCIEREMKLRKLDSMALAEVSRKNQVSICEAVIKGPLQGATHFVSGIDMGGKVYREVTTKLMRSQQEVGANAHGKIGKAVEYGVDFNEKATSKSGSKERQVRFILHPNVKEMKGRNTVIEKENEVVIAYQVLPITALVRNLEWRESMRFAIRKIIETEMRESPAFIDAGRPILLKFGSDYLCLNDDHTISMTDSSKKATPIYIEMAYKRNKSENPVTIAGTLFHIAFRKKKQNFYFSLGSAGNLQLVPFLSDPSLGTFHLEHPGSRRPAALSTWPTTSLILVWKTGFIFTTSLCLMFTAEKEKLNGYFAEAPRHADLATFAQFEIENVSMIEDGDEADNYLDSGNEESADD